MNFLMYSHPRSHVRLTLSCARHSERMAQGQHFLCASMASSVSIFLVSIFGFIFSHPRAYPVTLAELRRILASSGALPVKVVQAPFPVFFPCHNVCFLILLYAILAYSGGCFPAANAAYALWLTYSVCNDIPSRSAAASIHSRFFAFVPFILSRHFSRNRDRNRYSSAIVPASPSAIPIPSW